MVPLRSIPLEHAPETAKHRKLASDSHDGGDSDATTAEAAPKHAAQSVRTSLRPPVLASEVLREDLAPKQVGEDFVRTAAIAIGGVALGAMALVDRLNVVLVVAAVLLIGVIGLGVFSWQYERRALFLLGTSTSGWLLAESGRFSWGHLWIATSMFVTSAGLLLRHSHRSSRAARVIVAIGIALSSAWMLSHASEFDLDRVGTALGWWSVGLAWTLPFLVVLSSTAFMKENSTGGCMVWAGLLVIWLCAHRLTVIAETHDALDADNLAWTLGAAFIALMALGAWQLLAWRECQLADRVTRPGS